MSAIALTCPTGGGDAEATAASLAASAASLLKITAADTLIHLI